MIASKRLQYATNVNTNISGSDICVPNTGILRSVNGLAFSNAYIRAFIVNVTISISRSTGGDLFETFTLEGTQKAASWDLVVSSVGDNTSTTFSITSAGQIQHTTAVVANWVSTTMRYSGTQIVTTDMATIINSTSGSHITTTMQLIDTTDASGVSNGALHVLGGATIAKKLNTLNLNANVSVTAANLRVPGTLTVTNITVNNLIQTNGSLSLTGNNNIIGTILMDSVGNVGIGMTNPSSILSVSSLVGGDGTIRVHNPSGGEASISFINNNNNIWVVGQGGWGLSTNLTIGYSGSANALVMNMTTTGNVGIGTVAPVSNLTISGDASFNGALQVLCTNSGRNVDAASFKAINDWNSIFTFANVAGVQRGYINGNSSSVYYSSSSDRRLKKDIVTMPSMKNKIMQMQPKQFKWTSDDQEDYGFIAQEVYELFPQFRTKIYGYNSSCTCSTIEHVISETCPVNHDEPVDNEGKPLYYSIDYGRFTPYITKALQETITDLQTTNDKINNVKTFLQLKYPGEIIG